MLLRWVVFTLQIIFLSWLNWKWHLQCLPLPMDWFHEGSSRQGCSKAALETGSMLATPETELSSLSTNHAHWASFNFIFQPSMGCIQKTSVFDMDSFCSVDPKPYKLVVDMLHTNDTAKCCILCCSLLSTTLPLFQVNETCIFFVV